jgi:allophanate hydrolase
MSPGAADENEAAAGTEPLATIDWTVPALRRALRDGTTTPGAVVAEAYRRLEELDDPAALISVRPRSDALAAAAALGPDDLERLPLAGIPIVVKDNIDVAGLPTTAACPSFTYYPDRSATVVARLEAAGAIVIGKANLDQFATGLVGTRSPFGTPRNPVDAAFVPGGSSSGSAVVVAAGVVPLALGTDTAGSGRVPASFTGIVGLKPTVGLLPNDGVVPAVAEIDCVSVLAPDVEGARLALAVMADDPELAVGSDRRPLTVAVPTAPGLAACDPGTLDAHLAAVELVRQLGHGIVEVDIDAFLRVGALLYAPGPWLRSRAQAFGEHLRDHPADADPTVARLVIGDGVGSVGDDDADDDTAARGELDALRPVATAVFAAADVLLLPVSPSMPTVSTAVADSVRTSSELGTYTNGVNLLGLAAAAVPVGTRGLGLPAGAMLVGPAGDDALLADLAASMLDLALRTGTDRARRVPAHTAAPDGFVDLAVVGAHLAGLPLNHQLTDNGATFVRATTTSSDYRLIALADSLPPNPGPARPGLVRVADGTGGRIAVEVWRLPTAGLGAFMVGVPAPLAIGTTRLADGSTVLGFVCEGIAAEGAPDLTATGGWRAWLSHRR